MQCASVDSSGLVHIVTDSGQACSYYLLTAGDTSFFSVLIDPHWIVNETGNYDILGTMFMAGLSLPLIAYLTSWSFQTLINMFSHRHDGDGY